MLLWRGTSCVRGTVEGDIYLSCIKAVDEPLAAWRRILQPLSLYTLDNMRRVRTNPVQRGRSPPRNSPELPDCGIATPAAAVAADLVYQPAGHPRTQMHQGNCTSKYLPCATSSLALTEIWSGLTSTPANLSGSDLLSSE